MSNVRRAHAAVARLPEYASEALGLALFMVSACGFALVLEHPGSPVREAIAPSALRRALMGLAVGATLVANVHTPWGRRSGAHWNPAATLAFWRLGHVRTADALAYILAQFVGAATGAAIAGLCAQGALADPHVHWVVTKPGMYGWPAAFAAEFAMAFVLFTVVLWLSASTRHAGLTPWAAGALVALYITFEAPISGMSLNPARTFGSALLARDWSGYAIYVFAPALAMLAAAEWRVRQCARTGRVIPGCAKLLHRAEDDCVFCGQRGAM
ncbi:MAG: aquaporin [Candidatus Eisenbacteria bacterium]